GGAAPSLPPGDLPSAARSLVEGTCSGRRRGPRPVPGPGRAQGAEHGPRRRRPVEGVEVDARRAGEEQLGALLRRVSDAELELGALVTARGGEGGLEPSGDRRVAELADPLR